MKDPEHVKRLSHETVPALRLLFEHDYGQSPTLPGLKIRLRKNFN